MLSFSVLGPIEISNGHNTVRPKGILRQTLLAALLANVGHLNTAGALIEELWGGLPPDRTGNALQAQISRLRRCLRWMEGDDTGARLITTPTGYMMTVRPGEVDALRFISTVECISQRAMQPAVVDLASDIAELRSALALWRGPVYGGLIRGPLCHATARRYEEAKDLARILLFDLEIRRGRPAEILPELTLALEQQPLNEQFCTLLMRALYLSGRQTEALEVYREFRHRLAEKLGLEPSPSLARYEAVILHHDLAAASVASGSATRSRITLQ
jgi:SARP family transcriptional regulator, regulator of embCAB operon